jgi:hypothetical protein
VKSVLLIPIAVLLAAALGLALLKAAGKPLHTRELAAAAIVSLLAAEAALLPAALNRGAPKSAMAQAALIGTVIHMFLALALAGVLWTLDLVGHRPAFLYWLLFLYWTSLAAAAAALVMFLRAAPNDPSPQRPA